MSFERNYFELSSSGEIVIRFEKIMDGKPPSVLTLAHEMIRLAALAYGIIIIIIMFMKD
jgi:hypothetical protein